MPHATYLSYGDYIDHRNAQEALLSKEFLDVQDRIDQVHTSVDDVRDDLQNLNDSIGGRFDVVDIRFDTVSTRFDGVDARFEGVDARFDAVDARFDRVDTRFDEVNTEIKAQISELRTETSMQISELRTETSAQFRDTNNQIIELRAETSAQFRDTNNQISELRAETMRMMAFSRNTALRNPTLRIRHLVAYHPDQGIVEPNLALFPKHADEFYSLRKPTTIRQRSILAYLAEFYDVLHLQPHSESEGSNDEDVVIQDPEATVDALESILGLNEENFIQFRQRAQLLANQPRPAPIKRSQLYPPANPPTHQRKRVEVRNKPINFYDFGNDDENKAKSGDSWNTSAFKNDPGVKWRLHSTPSSQQKSVTKRAKKKRRAEEEERKGVEEEEEEDEEEEDDDEEKEDEERKGGTEGKGKGKDHGSDDRGSTTNPNTSPRQS